MSQQNIQILFSPGPTFVASIDIDATVEQTHTGDAEVTEHPVEVGADITDHIRVKNAELLLECIVADYRLHSPSGQVPNSGAGGQPLLPGQIQQAQNSLIYYQNQFNSLVGGPGAGASPGEQAPSGPNGQPQDSATSQPSRSRNVLVQLLALKDAAQPVTVQAGLRSYKNMAIVSLIEHRNASTGSRAIFFTLRLKEIRFATTETVAPPTNRNAATKGAKGNKPSTTADPSQTTSVLMKWSGQGVVPKVVGALQGGFTKLVGPGG